MNNYQIYEEIGQGRNSVVRKGRRKNTIEYYAIASYDKGQRARVNTSVQFLRSLSHPNVLKFFNWYETANHLWVITELCTGGNLRTILTEETRLPEVSIRVLAGDIARGLSYLHSRGVLYVELKPSNLLLDATGQLRFYDFGLAIVFSHADKAGRVGAPSFMAPERFEEDAVPSMASDLWSFGCVLYEMAAGRPPFDGATTKELISNIVSVPHKSLSGMGLSSASFSALVDALLRKDPAVRGTWADVAASEVFAGFVAPEQFPKQPHFEAYLKRKAAEAAAAGGGPDGAASGGGGYADSPLKSTAQRREHDVLRASVNAERNMNRARAVRTDQSSGYGESALKRAAAAAAAEREKEGEGKKGGGLAAEKVTIVETNDTLIDPKVTIPSVPPSASKAKAEHDMELDFRDPDAVEEGTAAAPPPPPSQIAPPSGPMIVNDDGGGALLPIGEVPSVSSPQEPPSSATAPLMATPHPQTPKGGGGGGLLGGGGGGMGGGGGGGGAAVGLPTSVEDLMAHPQDAHLRPLVANSRIEKHIEARADIAALQAAFPRIAPLPPLQVRELSQEKKDAFLNAIYDALAPPSSSSSSAAPSNAEKTNLLYYFESLSSDAQIAEMVANSNLMRLFAQLVASPTSSPSPSSAAPPQQGPAAPSARPASASVASANSAQTQLRLQIATVMGFLVRHSNYIDDTLHGPALVSSLLSAYKAEGNQKVKRRLLACLGELLFYITSRPPAQRPSWRIDGAAISEAYAAIITESDDMVLLHYAAKMIENTCSVGDVSAAILFKFTAPTVVAGLLSRYDKLMAPVSVAGAGTSAAGASRANSYLEHLRVAVACAALKLCLVDHTLFAQVLTWPTFEPATFLNEVAAYAVAPPSPPPQPPTAGAASPSSQPPNRHNPKVIQLYLTVLIGAFAKTMTLNATACGPFLKSLSWAKQDTSATCSVFSAAASPNAFSMFALDAPVMGKVRQTVATLLPRLLLRHSNANNSNNISSNNGGTNNNNGGGGAASSSGAFLSHPSSPIRAKSALLVALLIIADECGITAPTAAPTLLTALRAEGGSSFTPSTVSAAGAGAGTATAAAATVGSLRPLIAQLSRDSADPHVQRCADAVIAIGQIAAIHALTSLSLGKPLLPPPAVATATVTLLYLDMAHYCLSASLSVKISSALDQPVALLGVLAKVLHRAAAEPQAFTPQLEGLLLLVEAVAGRAMRSAEAADAAEAASVAKAAAAIGGGGGKGAAYIAGDSAFVPAASALLATDGSAPPTPTAVACINAKVREVVRVIASAVLPALLPAIEGATARAAAAAASGEAPTPTPPPPSSSRPASAYPSAAGGGMVPSPPSSLLHAALPPHLAPSPALDMPFVLLKFTGDLLIPIVSGSAVVPNAHGADAAPTLGHGGDVANSLFLFGKGFIRLVPALLELRDKCPPPPPRGGDNDGSTPPLSNGSFAGVNNNAANNAGGEQQQQQQQQQQVDTAASSSFLVSPLSCGGGGGGGGLYGATALSMVLPTALRVLSLLCDACPSLTASLRTAAFADSLMSALKGVQSAAQLSPQALALLLRLLKVGPEESGGGGGGRSITASLMGAAATASSSHSALSPSSAVRNSRVGAVATAHDTPTTIDLDLLRHCVTKHQLLQWAMKAAASCLGGGTGGDGGASSPSSALAFSSPSADGLSSMPRYDAGAAGPMEWSLLEPIVGFLMELVFLVVYAASQHTASEMAMVCGHLVAGTDTTPAESLLLRVCVDHPSAASAADCASSCLFLLVGLFEEARRLLVKPRVLTQIREVLSKTCFGGGEGGGGHSQGGALSSSQAMALGGVGVGVGGAEERGLYPHVAAPLLQSLVVLARVAGPQQLQCDELLLLQAQQLAEECPHPQVAGLCRELVSLLLS